MPGRLRDWASVVKRDAYAIYLAAQDPRVPWHTKLLALCVAAYAFSPIDLIPDFIPVIGLLDDAVIVPLGILLVIKMVPAEVMAEHRASALAARNRPISKAAGAAVIAVWVLAAAASAWLTMRCLFGGRG
jgi:uncharacterized membrane protein YkvA (DUF1232 family)